MRTSLYDSEGLGVFDGSNARDALAFRCQQYIFPYEHAYSTVSLVDARVHPRIAEYEQQQVILIEDTYRL